mmetsp:Transcript_44731/g.103453  ORF Transcript_44731/g.103453 Transcript_44731/m.103453 type:complete len:120 (-) Transcript_44731:53-412(-)
MCVLFQILRRQPSVSSGPATAALSLLASVVLHTELLTVASLKHSKLWQCAPRTCAVLAPTARHAHSLTQQSLHEPFQAHRGQHTNRLSAGWLEKLRPSLNIYLSSAVNAVADRDTPAAL